MPARRPHHRSIWEMTDKASLALFKARLAASLRDIATYVDDSQHVGPCVYRISHPGIRLRALVARSSDEFRSLIEHPIEEPQE